MRIGRLRVAVAALGTIALVTATARCGSAQEKVEVEEKHSDEAPFIVRSGGFGGGSYLGVYISEVSADDVSQLGLKQERGARIEDVSEDGPAQQAGLQKDDVIVGWNDGPVESASQLQRLVTETPAGREVDLDVMRDGKKRDVKVTIAERESMVRSFSFRGPDTEQMEGMVERLRVHAPEARGNFFAFMGGSRMGVGIQSVGDQLGEYFGLDGRKGVLVTSVEEDSPAEQAGLKAGDIILSIGGEAVDGTGGLVQAVREADEGPIAVGILRDRNERTVTVELPEAPEFKWKSGDGEEFSWEGDDGKVLMRIPEAVEGAMMVVPEIMEDLHMEWRGPESGVRIRIPAAERVESVSKGRVRT